MEIIKMEDRTVHNGICLNVDPRDLVLALGLAVEIPLDIPAAVVVADLDKALGDAAALLVASEPDPAGELTAVTTATIAELKDHVIVAPLTGLVILPGLSEKAVPVPGVGSAPGARNEAAVLVPGGRKDSDAQS